MKKMFIAIIAVVLMLAAKEMFAAETKYEGWKKCGGCHKSEKDSWVETIHAKAMHVLKPGEHIKEKKKAKLDPEKDYTKDKDCLPCHTTGYGKKGGYRDDMSEEEAKYLLGVGCEECHGAGNQYRKKHSADGKAFKATNQKGVRQTLVDAGQNFDYENACAKCHMNYEGSPWEGAKEPYTPMNPKVDKKYMFDFQDALQDSGKVKKMHEHFKLRGVYDGEPVPSFRAELQKKAKNPGAEEEVKDED